MSGFSGVRPALDIGRVLRAAFAVTGRNLPVFLALTVLLVGLPSAGLGAWQYAAAIPRGVNPAYVSFYLANVAVTVTQDAALIFAAIGALRGDRVSVANTLGGVLRRLPGILALEILYLVGCAAGLVLLVVPGVIIMLAWRVSIAAYLIEGTSVVGALRRSAELTRGHRWRILGLIVATSAASLVVWAGFAWLTTLAQSAGTAGVWAVVLVSNPLFSVLTGLALPPVGAALYRDLRRLHDGVGVEGVATVFD